jgi:hypothetical protein
MSAPKEIIIMDGVPMQVDTLAVEKAQQCDDCGEVKELRPYGPGGSTVCFDCMMKDEEEGKRQMSKLYGWDQPEKRGTL